MRRSRRVHLPQTRCMDDLLMDLALAAAEADARREREVREMVRRVVKAARLNEAPVADICAGDVTDRRGAWLVGRRARRTEVS